MAPASVNRLMQDFLEQRLSRRGKRLGAKCVRVEQQAASATAHFEGGRVATGDAPAPVRRIPGSAGCCQPIAGCQRWPWSRSRPGPSLPGYAGTVPAVRRKLCPCL